MRARVRVSPHLSGLEQERTGLAHKDIFQTIVHVPTKARKIKQTTDKDRDKDRGRPDEMTRQDAQIRWQRQDKNASNASKGMG